MSDPLLLTLVVTLGLVAVVIYKSRVLPGVTGMSHPSIVVDVWGPVAVILPMVAMGIRVEDTVAGAGWVALGGPAACLMLGLGAAIIMIGRSIPAVEFTDGARWRLTLLVGGAGVLLLLLGAAHVMTVGIGQCAFAAAALILWMNTPALGDVGQPTESGQDMPGLWVMLCLLAAIGQSVAIVELEGELSTIAGAVVVGQVSVVLIMAAVISGARLAVRLAGWVAGLGVLLGLGAISLRRLIPMAMSMDVSPEQTQVAFGFGAFAWEGAILIAAAPALAWLVRPGTVRPPQVFGWTLMVAGVALTVWRISAAM